jgi:hypothetical protein
MIETIIFIMLSCLAIGFMLGYSMGWDFRGQKDRGDSDG